MGITAMLLENNSSSGETTRLKATAKTISKTKKAIKSKKTFFNPTI
jgi:hypothetical protein